MDSIKYLTMWDEYGLETLFNITEWEKLLMWNVLKGDPPPPSPSLKTLIIRAMANSHRRYEIYIFETDGLSEEMVKETFESSPQFMADFIRQHGCELPSD